MKKYKIYDRGLDEYRDEIYDTREQALNEFATYWKQVRYNEELAATIESHLFDENDPELENKFKAYLDNLDNYHYLVDNEFFVEQVEVDDLEGRLNSGLELQLFFFKTPSNS